MAPSKPRLRVSLLASLAVALAVAAAWWLRRPERGEPPSSADAPSFAEGTVPARTAVALPAPAPNAIDVLRAKKAPGMDRFSVEAAEELLAPRLESLSAVLLEPAAASARDAARAVVDVSFSSSGLVPAGERRLLAEDGVAAGALLFAPGATPVQGAAGLVTAAMQLLAPVERAEQASFKVVGIHGDPASASLEAEVYLTLVGADPGGARHEWLGSARLGWKRESGDAAPWMLRSWEWGEVTHTRLAARPFLDVTARAFGGNRSHAELLVPGLDDFRARIDGATGIDVYGHHGAAVGDVNGDDIDDIYVATAPGLPNLLYLGSEDGTFVDAGRAWGADVIDGTHQALFFDVDNDGDQDLFLVTETGPLLLRHTGSRFEAAPDAIPVVAGARSTPISAAAADYDRDGFVDVHVCSYVFWRGTVSEVGSRLPFPYHEAHNGAPSFLLRNRGDGTFEDATARAGLDVDNTRFSFAPAWGDADGDGDPDLYIANDFGSKRFFRNRGDGTFTEAAAAAGILDVGAGMSVAWEDYDRDGDLDLYVGNMLSSAGRRVTGTADYKAATPELQAIYRRHARGNSLFRNRGDGTFDEVSEASRAYFGRWAWASGFVDFNLDGREDIFVQNGFISSSRKDDL